MRFPGFDIRTFGVTRAVAVLSMLAACSAVGGGAFAQQSGLQPFFGRSEATPVGESGLSLVAFLTADGQRISNGLVWRVYRLSRLNEEPTLVITERRAVPRIKLPPGRYAVNAAFGRAFLTQMVRVPPGRFVQEKFVLNAGGLRVRTRLVDSRAKFSGSVTYDVYSDERDQHGARQKVISNARPNLIMRLNSGIYHIVSKLGDANALVSAEVTVEAGKLTDATVSHQAGKALFKLVRQARGEALADAQWIIMDQSGSIVKESAGAIPSHVLAPGQYTVSARWGGNLYSRTFAIKSGDNIEVEVLLQ